MFLYYHSRSSTYIEVYRWAGGLRKGETLRNGLPKKCVPALGSIKEGGSGANIKKGIPSHNVADRLSQRVSIRYKEEYSSRARWMTQQLVRNRSVPPKKELGVETDNLAILP